MEWLRPADRRDLRRRIRRVLGRGAPSPGNYPLENKLHHHVTAIGALVVVATGLL